MFCRSTLYAARPARFSISPVSGMFLCVALVCLYLAARMALENRAEYQRLQNYNRCHLTDQAHCTL